MLADPRLRIGSVFAHDYRVIVPLDEGGMGVIYRVEQLSTGEHRALKVLKARLLTDARSRDRFNQEATVGSHIASEHIVKVIAAGVDDETGIPWIAMELLEGENLLAMVRARDGLPRGEVLEIARQLCHALAAAHANGVVHRDLKPENVFVAQALRPGGGQTVKLIDFGIARVLQDYETSATPTTVLGSPLWMAPEQIKRARIRPATDVWALGLLVFFALTGRFYWRSAADDESGPAPVEALLHEKLFEPIEPASKRATALGLAPLPRGFDAWFARCVVRDVEARFRDAGEAFEALEAVLERGHVARPRSARGALLLGAVALAGLATFGVLRAHGAADRRPLASPAPVRRVALWRAVTTDAAVESARDAAASAVSSAPPPARPRVHAAAAPVAHVPPHAEGYSFRGERSLGGFCASTRFGRAWGAVPDWFADGHDALARARQTLAVERRAQSAGTAPEIEQHGRDLAARERAFVASTARQVPIERARIHALAEAAGCATSGLLESDEAVYSIWCCP